MQHFQPDALSYAFSNAQRITKIEELVQHQPLNEIVELLKIINKQLQFLETRVDLLEKENKDGI